MLSQLPHSASDDSDPIPVASFDPVITRRDAVLHVNPQPSLGGIFQIALAVEAKFDKDRCFVSTITQPTPYSPFIDGNYNPTRLHTDLIAAGVFRLFLTGSAFDIQVVTAACHASLHGFDTYVVIDACRVQSESGRFKAHGACLVHNVRMINSFELKNA